MKTTWLNHGSELNQGVLGTLWKVTHKTRIFAVFVPSPNNWRTAAKQAVIRFLHQEPQPNKQIHVHEAFPPSEGD